MATQIENELWDMDHRIQTWRLIWNSCQRLFLPVSPTICVSMNYLHHYFEQGIRLDVSLFQIALLATFIAGKTEDTFSNIDDVIKSFAQTAAEFDEEKLSVLQTSISIVTPLIDPKSVEFSTFKNDVLNNELHFLTAMGWKFPNQNPFFILVDWLEKLKARIESEDNQEEIEKIINNSTHNLCILIIFPDTLHMKTADLAYASLEKAWNNSMFAGDESFPSWKAIINLVCIDRTTGDSLFDQSVQELLQSRFDNWNGNRQ